MLRIILIIAMFFPTHQQQQYALHVVFVEPAGESFTNDEMILAQQNVQGAIQYWKDLSPIPIDIRVADTMFITVSDSIFDDISVAQAWDTLYVIDNSTGGRYLFGDNAGWSTTSTMYVVTAANASAYAHEFGHYYFALGHQYQEPIDIMSLAPDVAYQRHTIGCASLAALGKPCYKVYIPKI